MSDSRFPRGAAAGALSTSMSVASRASAMYGGLYDLWQMNNHLHIWSYFKKDPTIVWEFVPSSGSTVFADGLSQLLKEIYVIFLSLDFCIYDSKANNTYIFTHPPVH